MGTATSLGQPSTAGSMGGPLPTFGNEMNHQDFGDMMFMGHNMMPPPPPTRIAPPIPQTRHPVNHQHSPQHQYQQPSADVLAAATLLQNGSSSRQNLAGPEFMFSRREAPPAALGPPVGHLRHQPLEEFKRAERISSYSDPPLAGDRHADMYSDMMFGTASSAERQQEGQSGGREGQPPPHIEVQFGSDSRFSRPQSFVPDSNRETYDALAESQLGLMQCLEPSQSAANTRPSSPTGDFTTRAQAKSSAEASRIEEDADAPPRKRRKSRIMQEDPEDHQDDTDGPSAKAAGKKKKSNAVASSPTGAPAPAENGVATTSKRRKSGNAAAAAAAAAAAKAPRENLTEAQKRENHIRSEQKRRTVIKEGFDDLCDLVPGLRGGGFSKSTILTMAGDWLEEILKGNERLAEQLNAFEGQRISRSG